MKRVTAVAFMAMMLGAFSTAASAQEYPPEILGEVEVSDTTIICPGGTVTVSGSAWEPGTQVTITLAGAVVATTTPDAQGSFSATITAPDAGTGERTLRASQDSEAAGRITGTATLTCVLAAEVGLAATGANISVWLVLVLGLFVVGGAAVVAGRRRKTEA